MQLQEAVNQLKLERERINLTLNTLEAMQDGKLSAIAVQEPKTTVNASGKRTFSPETRKKMSESKKQYWAFVHAKQKEQASGKVKF